MILSITSYEKGCLSIISNKKGFVSYWFVVINWPSYPYYKAVRHWSCPLNWYRDRIILFWLHMPKWAQTCEKILSQVGLHPTTSRFWGRHSTGRATVAVDFCVCVVGLQTVCEMRPCCLQQMKMSHCWLIHYYNRIAAGFANKPPSLTILYIHLTVFIYIYLPAIQIHV